MKKYTVTTRITVKANSFHEAALKAAAKSPYVFSVDYQGDERTINLKKTDAKPTSKFSEDDLIDLQKKIAKSVMDMVPMLKNSGYDYGIAAALAGISRKMHNAPKNNIDASVKYAQNVLDSINALGWEKNRVRAKKATSTLAKQQFENALRSVLPDIRKWSDDTMKMMGLVLGDFADHLKLACAIAENDLKKVGKFADMDTSSREMIPMRVWNWINKVT